MIRAVLTIIIPAYNEAAVIGDVLADLHANLGDVPAEIVVVDDGSSDDTAAIVEAATAEMSNLRLVRHPRNRGYGASLTTGIRAARTEWVLTMDSDGQHKTTDVVRLWEAAGPDAVIGQRRKLLHSPLWRMPGKWLLGFMAQILAERKIPDLNSGLRLMRREVVNRYLHLCPSGFSFSTTTTMALLSRGYHVEWLPIDVEQRVGKSRVTWKTGLATIMLIVRITALFNPLRIFLPVSFLFGIGGVLWGVPYILLGNGLSVGAMLLIVTGVLLFAFGVLADQISQLRLERFE
ncbi:MAG: glycosyltransferase family 2 protein [Acidobacteriota bacterium]